MKCIRCGETFYHPGSNICGNCADDLRDEELASVLVAEYEADEVARLQYEDAERRAYEADDRGTYELHGGYR